MKSILVVDDQKSVRLAFQAMLAKENYSVRTADDYHSALERLCSEKFDIIFVDILLGKKSGIDLLKAIKDKGLYCPAILMTGNPDIESTAEAVRLGAYDYLTKPIEKETILRVASQAIRHKELWDEKNRIQTEKERYRCNLEAIFKSLQDAIVTVDLDLKVIEVNHAAKFICGFSPKEIIGHSFQEIPQPCKKTCEKVLRETLSTKERVSEFRIECMHRIRPRQVVELSCSPLINENNEFIGAVLVIRDVSRITDLERELIERHQFQQIIGKNAKMLEIYNLLEALSDTETTVMIKGESGTGKGLVAKALHYSGVRALQPMISVNCSALSENLLESELFGHVKGAFTGAIKDKIGRFEMGNEGTVFLDDIGDISPRIQLKLLRVIQDRIYESVGDSNPRKVDVRIIAATNKDLKEKVRLGEFREDLYYRLKVIEIELPPLRKRLDDVPLLATHFCEMFNQRFGKEIRGVSDEVLSLLIQYHWPGNIRELEHAIEHAFVLCRGNTITIDDLPSEIRESSPLKENPSGYMTMGENDILEALKKAGGNKAKAARILGVSRQTIYRKLQSHHKNSSKI